MLSKIGSQRWQAARGTSKKTVLRQEDLDRMTMAPKLNMSANPISLEIPFSPTQLVNRVRFTRRVRVGGCATEVIRK